MRFDDVKEYRVHCLAGQPVTVLRSVMTLQDWFCRQLGAEDCRALFLKLPSENKIELLRAIFLADGDALAKALEPILAANPNRFLFAGIHNLALQPNVKDLFMPNPDMPEDRYLSKAAMGLVSAILGTAEKYSKEDVKSGKIAAERAYLLKMAVTNIPDDQMGMMARKRILSELSPDIASSVTDPGYAPLIENITALPVARAGAGSEVIGSGVVVGAGVPMPASAHQLSVLSRMFDGELTPSEFILLAGDYLKKNGLDITEVERDYGALRYGDAIRVVHRLATDNPHLPFADKILSRTRESLSAADPTKNDERRYMETSMAKAYFGEAFTSGVEYEALRPVIEYFNKTLGVGYFPRADLLPTQKQRSNHVEAAILAITDSDQIIGFGVARIKEKVYKRLSKLNFNATKARGIQPGSLTRRDLSLHPDVRPGATETDGADALVKLPSVAPGVLRRGQMVYVDERTDIAVNRSPDVHRIDTRKAHAFPLENPEIPFTASLSGHVYFVVAILEEYLKNTTTRDVGLLNRQINAFLLATLHAYVKQGYHSQHEILKVLEECAGKFSKYGVILNFQTPPEVLSTAFERGAKYVYDTHLGSLLGEDLHKKIHDRSLERSEVSVAPMIAVDAIPSSSRGVSREEAPATISVATAAMAPVPDVSAGVPLEKGRRDFVKPPLQRQNAFLFLPESISSSRSSSPVSTSPEVDSGSSPSPSGGAGKK